MQAVVFQHAAPFLDYSRASKQIYCARIMACKHVPITQLLEGVMSIPNHTQIH